MSNKRKKGRSVKGIALDDENWNLLAVIADRLNTNKSNLIEALINEKYGNEKTHVKSKRGSTKHSK